MISNLGKILDPVADKLTQGVVILCLVSRFSLMGGTLVLFVVKEIINVVSHIIMMRKSEKVIGANWHGKVVTVLPYVLMFIHIAWSNIPKTFSNVSVTLCIAMIISMQSIGQRER